MGDNKENSNQNNFNGPTIFNGPTQVAARDIINKFSDDSHQKATYIPEPLWRSPFTLAVLSWISLGIALIGVFPISKIIKNALSILSGTSQTQTISNFEFQIYLIIFVILTLLFILLFSLRRITKNQTRYPLLFNYAISGYSGRLILEKVRINGCPQCGGEMKYYNKPVKWNEIPRNDGSIKTKVTKRSPALECKRNSKHWYEVDPAENKVK